MKRILFLLLIISLPSASFANHTKGGWMYYEYMGPGAAANSSLYRITLKLYTLCELNQGQTDASIPFTFFNGSTFAQLFTVSAPVISDINTTNCATAACHPCIIDIPLICYKIRTYQIMQELPNTASGYIISYQRCCRIQGIINIQAPSNNQGETWTVKIPGTTIPDGVTNTSAKFAQNDTAIICRDNRFTFDFSATDFNNDSLIYAFTPAFTGGSNTNPAPTNSSSPPFTSVPYATGFSGAQPMGSSVTINRFTGIVSGIAPAPGVYVVTVTVSEYKRGTNILKAEVRKSLHIEVTNCSLTEVVLAPEYTSCDGFTLTFQNGNDANITTYDWSFGDGSTSTQATPTHTYADTGVYVLKLVVNRGQPCSDSATALVKVFPGFRPDFTILGQCKNTAIQFKDITTADYGVINKWSWDFGDPGSSSNTSTLQNPTHVYATTGNYDVIFVVQSSKGCIDTVRKTFEVKDKPDFTVSNDTLICIIDTLQLHAVGAGSFVWSPNYMISNVNSPDPFVSPDVTTTYHVVMTDAFGCQGSDDVTVNVKPFVTLFAQPDTTICRTDPVQLRITSDALYYLWTETPAGNTLNNPTIKNPTATPLQTTTYHLVASIGKCVANADIKVTPIPYPAANAGPDQHICVGFSAQLNASGGSIYSWTPSAFLTATNIPNPVSVRPTDNVRYVVTVKDVLGCPKAVKDTMILYVDKILANAGPRDTSVVLGQPLQLGASGGTNYSWTPTTWLNNPNISNPVSLPQNNIEYVVRVSNDIGCFGYDTILVKVFRLSPSFYVPNAFSPNGDGLNDIFRPVAIGMKSIDVFRVYNRWGQMLYSGSGNGVGWDGKFGGRPQEAATYVWYAEGVDYLNNTVKKKGTVILVR